MLRRLFAVVLAPVAVFAAPAAALATTTTVAALVPPPPMPVQSVTGATLAAIAGKLAHNLVTDPDRSVVPAFAVQDQSVPAGKVEIVTKTPQVYATYVAIPLQISVDGLVAKTITAGYRVQQFIHTAVAAHDLAPGALLTADDLTTARVLSNGRPSIDVATLVGRKIRAATPRGAQIYVEQTAVNELVKAGAGAILIVRDGPVNLTADVIARSGGGLGDTVMVYNAQTNKVLSGTVIGADRVELVLPGDNE